MINEHDNVRALLAYFDPRCELLRITRPRGGLTHNVLFASTTRGEYVVKVVDNAADRWKLQKEAALFDHMRSIGLPTPRIYRIDASRQVIPFIYALAERCPGEPWSAASATMTESQMTGIYATLGDFLGRLHATTFGRFGDITGSADGLRLAPLREWEGNEDDQDAGPFSTWGAMHAATVSDRLRFLRGTRFEDLLSAVERYFDARSHLIDYSVTPRLLHMDLHGGNVLVHEGRVSAILDVEEAVAGHNEYDLMRTELAHFRGRPPEHANAFMCAYQRHVQIDDGYAERKDFYDVSRTLVWMKCLVMYGDNYGGGLASQSHDAARAHLRSLLSR